jgi:hypothetical protein
VIDPETRKQLGEYYTPDWLAEGIVQKVVDRPLSQRVLDPACGSGTFLFWSARRYLESAESESISSEDAILGLVGHVAGIDLHPVAVCLARVTYLLAIGAERLQGDRPAFSVPVYLGDSLRWDQDETLFAKGGITIPTSGSLGDGGKDLHFPERVVANSNLFDQLIAALADRAVSRSRGSKPPEIGPILRRYSVQAADRPAVVTAFDVLCSLHDEGRNHIWGYYVRNLARPFAFTRPDNQVDVVVGNPPWLAYRFMTDGMQKRYGELAKERHLWAGGKVATNQDLADLFVVRCFEQYLTPRGRFGFVMPGGALSRQAYEGFRSGRFDAPSASTAVAFGQPWDLRGVVPGIFPMPACAVFGERSSRGREMPAEAQSFAGKVQGSGARWTDALSGILIRTNRVQRGRAASHRSPYADSFRQGATVVPSVLLRVSDCEPGPLGAPKGMRRVSSLRSSLEKKPWKTLDSLEGAIESRFVKRVLLGSGIAPFKPLREIEAVIPLHRGGLLDGGTSTLDEFPGLASWWREAEELWENNKSARSKLTLSERLNYQRGITNQLPVGEHRVVYTQSGNQIAACRLENSAALVEHSLYWASVATADEARYLVAIFNSAPLHNAVEPLMSEGLFGKRHIDKYLFAAPFPVFNAADTGHLGLARLGQIAEEETTKVDLLEKWGFQKCRRVIRDSLREHGVSVEIDAAVAELLAIGLEPTKRRSGDASKASPDLMGAFSEAERSGGKTREPTKRKTAKSLSKTGPKSPA